MQVKRIHAYKRQLLNVLGVIHRYQAIKDMSAEEKAQVLLHRANPPPPPSPGARARDLY